MSESHTEETTDPLQGMRVVMLVVTPEQWQAINEMLHEDDEETYYFGPPETWD
jgi:hypothetical protein